TWVLLPPSCSNLAAWIWVCSDILGCKAYHQRLGKKRKLELFQSRYRGAHLSVVFMCNAARPRLRVLTASRRQQKRDSRSEMVQELAGEDALRYGGGVQIPSL